jgi:hypothetical protein
MLRRTTFLSNIFSRFYATKTVKMSTFTLPDTDVSIKLVDGLTKEQLLEFPAFKVPTPTALHRNNIASSP